MKQHPLPWITLILSLTFALAPFLSSPFQGFTETQLPVPQIDPPIQPAGWAFSIWLPIYAWLVISAAYGAFARFDSPKWQAMRPALIASLLIGTPWLWIANTSALWATITIFLMLITALLALMAVDKQEWIWLQGPIGLYAGWLSAAAFVSLGSTVAGYGLMGAVPAAWMSILLALGLILLVLWQTGGALTYALASAWALIGIAVSNGFSHISVTLLASLGVVAIVLISLKSMGIPLPKKNPKSEVPPTL